MTEERVYPSVKQGVLLVLIAFALLYSLSYGLSVFAENIGVPSDAAFTVAYILSFGGVFVYGFKRAKAPLRSILPIKPVSPRLYLPIAAMTAGLFLLGWEFIRLCALLLEQISPDSVPDDDTPYGELWNFAVAALLLAPLLEEALFRGLLLRGFLAHRSRWKAIWISSILFAFIHVANPFQLLPVGALGVAFAWWRVETGSVLPSAIGHFFCNLLAVASYLSTEIVYASLIIAGGVGLLLLGIWSLRRLLQNPLDEEQRGAETPPPE